MCKLYLIILENLESIILKTFTVIIIKLISHKKSTSKFKVAGSMMSQVPINLHDGRTNKNLSAFKNAIRQTEKAYFISLLSIIYELCCYLLWTTWNVFEKPVVFLLRMHQEVSHLHTEKVGNAM